MAAISSTLQADFSDFVAETQKANVALSDMQREAISTSTAVTTTASSMGKFGSTATTSTSGINSLSTSLRTADKTLGAFGVSIGPQIAALEEMEQAAGKTAAELGLLGTAMSVAGAALAGWNIGKAIDDMAGGAFSKGVANDVAAMLGWGNAAEQAAGATDTLIARARALGYAGDDVTEAAQRVTEAHKKQQEVFNTGADRVRTWTHDLTDANTNQAALRAEIEAGNSTVAQMVQHYNVSAEAVQYLTREIGKETTARKEAEAAAKKQGETLKKEAEDRAKDLAAAQKIISTANEQWNYEMGAASRTTTEALIADIDRWKAAQIAALDATGGATENHYTLIAGIAAEKLTQVNVNWDVLKAGAIASYADQAARAEATYQEMLAHSTSYTTEAIANALKLRDETLATYEAMNSAHSAAYTEFLKRDKSYADALKQFQTEAATASETAYQKQTAALDTAIAYSQTYGVTIEEAKVKLSQMGDTGEQAGQRTTTAMAAATQQVGQLTVMAQQSAAQMETLARHYDQMAQANLQGGGTGLGWSPAQVGLNYQESARKLREQAGKKNYYEQMVGGAAWGATPATTNLSVNVNNADAQGVANRIVTELRHAGVRFG